MRSQSSLDKLRCNYTASRVNQLSERGFSTTARVSFLAGRSGSIALQRQRRQQRERLSLVSINWKRHTISLAIVNGLILMHAYGQPALAGCEEAKFI